MGDLDFANQDPVENFLGDYRIASFSPRAPRQRPDIALVTITEDTLRDYPYVSPIPRRLLAKLIEEIARASPKVIGLDILVDRPSPEDALLVAATRATAVPMVWGTIDDRYVASSTRPRMLREVIQAQENFIAQAGCKAGHVWLEHRTGLMVQDSATIRYVGESQVGSPARDSFAAVTARMAGHPHEPSTTRIAWLRSPPDTATPLFAELQVRRHSPSDLDSKSPLLSEVEASLLKGRIVLVGATLDDRDRHKTPLNPAGGLLMPGLMIHAQAIAQRIDGDRDVRSLPDWLVLAIFFLSAFVCLRPGIHKVPKTAAIALGLIGLIAYTASNVEFPTGGLIFIAAAAVTIASVGRRLSLWLQLRRPSAEANNLPERGAPS
ncbi:CHASE2 domain-containing protein [Rhodopseudomonas sp. G2_2311]|uniref:CHASE2 domain-containing protein n=1 Tax=Rhodopseudomonas sp. G2_2311 TaxID=3114287 RepID=UPI0039C6A075